MLKQPRFRLSADPSIGVTDLMQPLSKYMEEEGDRNFIKLLHVSLTFSWTTSLSGITFLSAHAPLFQRYAKIAPNSVLPPKKNKIAIERLDQQMKCNFSKQSTSDYVELVDNIVRTAMKQHRYLAKDPHAKGYYRKADSQTQDAINLSAPWTLTLVLRRSPSQRVRSRLDAKDAKSHVMDSENYKFDRRTRPRRKTLAEHCALGS